MKTIRGLLSLLVLALMPALTLGHHSGAMFDDQKTIVLKGKVEEFNWTNPHSSIKAAVPDTSGQPVVWAIEMNSPGNLVREGWKRTTLKPGDEVAVLVHPLRDGKPGAIYLAIQLADGSILAPAGSGHDKTLADALR